MKNLTFILLIITLLGCKQNEQKNDELISTYEILKVLYDDVILKHAKITAFQPPPPPNSNIDLDSIMKIAETDRNVKKDTGKRIRDKIKRIGRSIVAIVPVLKPPYYTKDIKKKYLKKCLDVGFKDVYTLYENIKDTINIDVSQISNNEYSYIFPYQNYYKKTPRRGYDKYNVVLNFSRISFNEDHTKAVVIMGVGFGKLNGFSAMYFLEKKNSKWIIKCKKGLTIS